MQSSIAAPIINHPNMQRDQLVFDLIDKELERQRHAIELIASENFTSLQVMQAMGGVMTNKYAEGYPGRRYYAGCEIVDQTEQLAIDRLKQIFNCEYANVQPHSGAQANAKRQSSKASSNDGDGRFQLFSSSSSSKVVDWTAI